MKCTEYITKPTERYLESKLLLLNRKIQCPSSKQFTRKWLFIYEKLCPDATFNIQRAITTLTLLPLLPNEQLEHHTNNSLSFLSFFYCFPRCSSSSSFLERFHWLNMACHRGIQHKHTTIKPEQFNIRRCCQKGPLQVIICSLS